MNNDEIVMEGLAPIDEDNSGIKETWRDASCREDYTVNGGIDFWWAIKRIPTTVKELKEEGFFNNKQPSSSCFSTEKTWVDGCKGEIFF